MARKTQAPDAQAPAAPEITEHNPQRGGSFVRCPDTGTLTQTGGPDMDQAEGNNIDPAAAAADAQE